MTDRSLLGEAFDDIDDEPLVVVDACDLLGQEYEPPSFLVRHLVPCRSVGLLSGDTGSLKSNAALSIAIAVATDLELALGHFEITHDPRPVLYVNGEMDRGVLLRFLHANATGLGVTIPSGRLLFEGNDGFANFFLGRGSADAARRFEALVQEHRPCCIIFDTLRELFELDENDAGQAREVFRWLRRLAQEYNLAITVLHHWRKLGVVSNGARERVAGSRDLIAAVDVHLALKAGHTRALYVDKTRYPFEGVRRGTEWPLEATFDDKVTPPRATIIANESSKGEAETTVEEAIEDLRARLEADGPMTRLQLGVTGGNAKRAYAMMRKTNELVEVGKEGRKPLYGLADPQAVRRLSDRGR